MVRSDPEKLAQALRANLKRRKAPPPARPPEPLPPDPPRAVVRAPEKPAKNSV